jgi:hypothetical protein
VPAKLIGPIQDHVFPVLLVDPSAERPTRSVCGTGFMLPGGLFVTCWHCVQTPPPLGHMYATARQRRDGTYEFLELSDLERDRNGADLALARLPDEYRPYPPTDQLVLGHTEINQGMNVSTFGYPLPDKGVDESGQSLITTHSRTLRGYMTRRILYPRPGWGPTPSFELDMPTPEGLSGAPLLAETSVNVIGVVYGTMASYLIEEQASVDPETGKLSPEVRRIYTFGLALTLNVLAMASSEATGGDPVAVFLEKISRDRSDKV